MTPSDIEMPHVDASTVYVAVHGDPNKPALGPYCSTDCADLRSLRRYLLELHPGYDLRPLFSDGDNHFRWELKQRT